MPDEDITFTDLVRGEITFGAGSVPDFVVVRADGSPLYTLVNPVDDAMMRITHVIRGEDLLSSTPRQIALYRALMEIGVAERVPTFAHLPLVLGGAIGNYIDRIARAFVIDFLEAHWYDKAAWPSFNVADAAIVVGVGLLMVDAFVRKETPTETPKQDKSAQARP